jgi:hypothetical protein
MVSTKFVFDVSIGKQVSGLFRRAYQKGYCAPRLADANCAPRSDCERGQVLGRKVEWPDRDGQVCQSLPFLGRTEAYSRYYRMASTEEIARSVAMLCSDEFTFMTYVGKHFIL